MIRKVFEQGEGVLRLAPTWVPRSFCIPGKRLKLHPADLYAYGAGRGGIDERWLASTTKADNGPLTTPNEGVSYVVWEHDGQVEKATLVDVVAELGAGLLGDKLWREYGRWPAFAKFFDNKGPIAHHMHHKQEHAQLVGQEHKPEAYYFPVQMNNYGADFPYTFFGLDPCTTPDQVRHCLEIWNQGDNHITDLSRAYRLELGTGWYVPPGVLHAPGSLCTYEPQWASDVFAMYQSLVSEVPIAWEMLVKNVPADKQNDFDFLLDMLDWEANVDPAFRETYARPPLPASPLDEMQEVGCHEYWVTYGNPYFAAKELTVLPGRTVLVRDPGPYGLIMVQGRGMLDKHPIETPTLIRFGQLTCDEYFVSAQAAQTGVMVRNLSASEPLVMLKHFGPTDEAPRSARGERLS